MSSTDDDAMRLAFEQYMMGGGGSGNSGTSQSLSQEDKVKVEAKKKAKEEELRNRQLQQQMKKAEKRYTQIFQKFGRLLRVEWLDIDDQAYQVVQAIVGIRSRLPMHARLIDRFQDETHAQKKDWDAYGYGNTLMSTSGGLKMREQDVHSALSHDLIQHEKMMDGLRRLFANISECHEALLRNLDEASKHHLECMEEFEGLIATPALERAYGLVSLMNDLLAMLSLELYRKQCMVHMILETVEDEVIKPRRVRNNDGDKGNDDEWEDLSPHGTVARCCKLWPRESKHGYVEMTALNYVLDMTKEV